MKYRVHANEVRTLARRLNVKPTTAAKKLADPDKHGRHYVAGLHAGLDGLTRLTRKDFPRSREYQSYLTGFQNGRRLANVFNNLLNQEVSFR